MILMRIFDHAEGCKAAVLAAGTNDGDFFFEFDERFEDRFFAIQGGERRFDVTVRAYFRLPLSVVAEAGGFQNGGMSELFDPMIKIFDQLDAAKRRYWK